MIFWYYYYYVELYIITFDLKNISGMAKYGGLAKLYFEEQEAGLIKVEYHKFKKNSFGSGAAFVPKEGGAEEDDAWVITFVHNEDTNISQVS